jgi:HEAT repeat protein
VKRLISVKLRLLGVAITLGFQLAYVCAQPGSTREETTASLLRRFQTADVIATKEGLLYRLVQRGGEAGKDLLTMAETTDDVNTRWLAIRGLGMMRFKEATPFLLDSLRSSEHDVRADAARALGEIRYTPATAVLIDLLRTEKDAGVTEQTAFALRMINAREAIPVLMSRMSSSSTQTKCWLLDSIGSLGSDAEIPYVVKYLYGFDEDPRGVTRIADCAARSLDALTHGEIGLGPPGGGYDALNKIRKAREWWETTGRNRLR